MREFFRGWRRKAGVITLILACVVVAANVRSFVVSDSIHIRLGIGRSLYADSGVGCWTINLSISPYQALHTPLWMTLDPSGVGFVDWDWKWGDFGYNHYQEEKIDIVTLMGPYWSLVLPLTLLSAYLILWKPRMRA
jgi:hypothetical protein